MNTVYSSSSSTGDVPLQGSIPQSTASLDSILCTEELHRRPSRPPDYEKENRALVKLVSALADSPDTIFHTLAETIKNVTQCDSAGLSLLTTDGKTPHVDGQRFYWPAICGMWNPHVGGGTPRDFGPCGDVLDQNRTLLFTHFERRYPYLMPVSPAAEECLLVPFHVNGKAVGTIWGIMHSDRRKFDAEDDRVMASLGKFASSAYQAWMHIEELKVEVAEREKAEAEVRQLAKGLEAKIRRLVESNIVGIMMFNVDGAITEANAAFLNMIQFKPDDVASGRVSWTDLTPCEWRGSDERAIEQINATGVAQPYEKEYFAKDGSRVPVIVGGALFAGSQSDGVAFVLDLSEQKRAQQRLEEARRSLYTTQGELARVARLTTMGELAASIAHEVNQPLTAVTNNGSACLRLLANRNLDPEVLKNALREIVADATRASAVIARIRAFIRKTPTEMSELDINDVIHDVLALAGHEIRKDQVSVDCQLTGTLPRVRADRVQLQQVLLNLVMNGVEAMTGDQPRTLSVQSRTDESGNVLVAVCDSGTGLGEETDSLFTPFFTTKANGMGLGLTISRSLIENHGGRLWASANSPRGAVFSFTLPAAGETNS
jgi:PAS domain S-box-containing protein